MTETQERLVAYARQYAAEVWPDLTYRDPTEDELFGMEIREDSYANAHVEGEHEANGLCSYTTPRECAERAVAAEYVETTDMEKTGMSYRIVRRYFSEDFAPEVLATGLTLDEALDWCSDPETSSQTATNPEAVERTALRGAWFDSYESE